jgi:hypothetical protein
VTAIARSKARAGSGELLYTSLPEVEMSINWLAPSNWYAVDKLAASLVARSERVNCSNSRAASL